MRREIRDLLRDAPALARVAARAGDSPADGWVTRFAPSPTGELHLGHVAHMLWVWGAADRLGARVLVRSEDHDRARSSLESERAILGEMDWLGFTGDAVSTASLRGGPSPYRQSDNGAVYAAAFEALATRGLVYGCTCTRGDMGPQGPDGERHYPGTCRGMPLDREGASVRVMLPDDVITFDDLRLGGVTQHPARDHGDVVIRDARGQWTYQWCVVIDDLRHGVNLVVRGEDILSSTGRQQLLGSLLGRTVPVRTLHHPLLFGADGLKLSKRHRSETVRAMRECGTTAEEILRRAYVASGLDALP